MNVKRLALAVLAVALLAPAPGAAKERTLRFKGELVIDDELGISVGPDERKQLIAVLSPRFRYALVLPYSRDWEFSREQGALLRGRAGLWNLTVAAWETDEKPDDHLAETRRRLEASPAGKGITKMETVSFKGQRVLRNEVDGGSFSREFRGVTVVHYFAAKAANGVLYELHLSVVVDPKKRDAFVDKDWLGYATVGFNVGERS